MLLAIPGVHVHRSRYTVRLGAEGVIDVSRLVVCVGELADAEFQRRAWLATDGPVVSSFQEQVSQTFDDTGLSEAIDADRCPQELDGELFAVLKKLDQAVSRVDQALRPEAQLNDLRMEEVRKQARVASKLLRKRYG